MIELFQAALDKAKVVCAGTGKNPLQIDITPQSRPDIAKQHGPFTTVTIYGTIDDQEATISVHIEGDKGQGRIKFGNTRYNGTLGPSDIKDHYPLLEQAVRDCDGGVPTKLALLISVLNPGTVDKVSAIAEEFEPQKPGCSWSYGIGG